MTGPKCYCWLRGGVGGEFEERERTRSKKMKVIIQKGNTRHMLYSLMRNGWGRCVGSHIICFHAKEPKGPQHSIASQTNTLDH